MDQNISGNSNTGTRDETYDLVAVLYHALQGAENCQVYLRDAQGQQELRQFFEQALQQQKQLAEQAKRLLHDQLMNRDQGGGMSGGMGSSGEGNESAFQFSGASSGSMSSSSGDSAGGTSARGADMADPGLAGGSGMSPSGGMSGDMTGGGRGGDPFGSR